MLVQIDYRLFKTYDKAEQLKKYIYNKIYSAEGTKILIITE